MLLTCVPQRVEAAAEGRDIAQVRQGHQRRHAEREGRTEHRHVERTELCAGGGGR